MLAACGAVVEDAGASWGAIYLKDDLGTAAAVAGLAFVALQTAMTIGRLTGDRVVDRFGQRTVVRTGGVVTAVGMGFALAVPERGDDADRLRDRGARGRDPRSRGDAHRRRAAGVCRQASGSRS